MKLVLSLNDIKIVLSLNDIKIMHDAVDMQEQMSNDDPETFGDKEQYSNLRERLKATIDHIENTAVVEATVAGE